MNNFNCLTTLVLVLLTSSTSSGTKYRCSIADNGETCKILRLKLTRDDYSIEPVADHPTVVTKVILSGTVPVLSNGICQAMSNLNILYANELSMEEIEEDAFEGCDKLSYLDLDDNNLVKMGKNTFKGLTSLEQLWLRGGNSPIVDLDLTDLKQLKWLGLRHFNITLFPAEILREQTNLADLMLFSNNLFDLDIEGILKFTPNLNQIELIDNNFKCSRLKEILVILKAKNVNTASHYVVEHQRRRKYIPSKIDGIHCLTDQQWETELSETTYRNLPTLYMQLFTIGQTITKVQTKTEENLMAISVVRDSLNEQLSFITKNFEDFRKSKDVKMSNQRVNKDSDILNNKHLQKTNVRMMRSNESLNVLFGALKDPENNSSNWQELKKLLNQIIVDHSNDREIFSTQLIALWIMCGMNCFMVVGVIVFRFVKFINRKRRMNENGDYYYSDAFMRASRGQSGPQRAR